MQKGGGFARAIMLFLVTYYGFYLSFSIVNQSDIKSFNNNSVVPTAYAHLEHFTHYNGNGDSIGKYYAYQALDPEYVGPGQTAKMIFSIQDVNGKDVYDVTTMVEVYQTSTGNRVGYYPWTRHTTGDFSIFHTFEELGNYQIVLSMANNPSSYNQGSDDPARSILGNNVGCNCDRAVFNISVSKSFGTIFTNTMLGAVIAPLAIIGSVLGISYHRKKKRQGADYENDVATTNSSEIKSDTTLSKIDVLKYAIMLSAIAGGLVHFAIYSEHASLRLEYSIFLIAAGGAQVTYGVLYVLLTLINNANSSYSKPYNQRDFYRKIFALNLFGLFGTSVLLGLYAYVVIFPPPLSPNNTPEDIDLAGVLAKSVEVFLVVGIIYIMRTERKEMKRQLASMR